MQQEGSPLLIINLLTNKVVKVRDAFFSSPTLTTQLIFLHHNRTFLAFRGGEVGVWNFRGEQVCTFEDHTLWLDPPTECMDHTIMTAVTQAHDVLLSACADACGGVSVHVSSLRTGKLLSRVEVSYASSQTPSEGVQITALGYSEDTGDIITGNERGHVHIWSPG